MAIVYSFSATMENKTTVDFTRILIIRFLGIETCAAEEYAAKYPDCRTGRLFSRQTLVFAPVSPLFYASNQ
jgi:hypothetical protein